MDTKALLRMRKFSWNKTHSVRSPTTSPQHQEQQTEKRMKNRPSVALKRSGSMNNIILGLRSEAIASGDFANQRHNNHNGSASSERKQTRRTQTFRLKKKIKSKSFEGRGSADADVSLRKQRCHDDQEHNDRDVNNIALARLSIFAPLVGMHAATDVSLKKYLAIPGGVNYPYSIS